MIMKNNTDVLLKGTKFTPEGGRERTFSFTVMMVTGGSSLSSDGAGDRELDTIGELTSNLQKQQYNKINWDVS